MDVVRSLEIKSNLMKLQQTTRISHLFNNTVQMLDHVYIFRKYIVFKQQ